MEDLENPEKCKQNNKSYLWPTENYYEHSVEYFSSYVARYFCVLVRQAKLCQLQFVFNYIFFVLTEEHISPLPNCLSMRKYILSSEPIFHQQTFGLQSDGH